ncbi:gluconate 2-dehydrogenase subunit 3 family protein [Thalassotalea fonticola]|uniref:Gluconate 2-dehydrogenase subunit 3 family protein n=1 Tax=Thalassotalea fonticola TaxID=3065649 RepID=A0ABZ0GKU4_9GAMM|nr:gluconate 2-dehydrogenase subunit 3 family protein [Colwelliaceae bacterium S1-1]
MITINSFFDDQYQTPPCLKQRLTRRTFLKSAAMTSALTALPVASFEKINIADLSQEPWLTLNSVLEHLLPSSASGPGAKELQAIHYLYNVVTQQPIEQDEKDFIEKGVGWLNGYTNGKLQKSFVDLTQVDKESSLTAISKSRAGENWISTLLSYLFEATLAPPIYGGNPNGIGWQWLKHKPGFPLPAQGKRYYELPAYAAIKVTNIDDKPTSKQTKGKAL